MATIEKRNNAYRITVCCGYDINGKQIRRRMTYTPDEKMTAKQIEKEVQRQAVLFEEQCREGTVGTDGRMKLADYVPIYLENAKHRLSPVVYEKYCRMLDICIVPMLGHFKLKDIKPIHIQRFVNALEERTTHLDGKEGKLTPSTIRRYYTMVQSVLHSAYKLGLIGTNPADSDRITLPKIAEQTTEIFTQEETAVLLDKLEDEPLQFKLLIHLALNEIAANQ